MAKKVMRQHNDYKEEKLTLWGIMSWLILVWLIFSLTYFLLMVFNLQWFIMNSNLPMNEGMHKLVIGSFVMIGIAHPIITISAGLMAWILMIYFVGRRCF